MQAVRLSQREVQMQKDQLRVQNELEHSQI